MILIVTSAFNSRITTQLQNSAEAELKSQNQKYKIITVPGAVEIPITIQQNLRTKKFKAAIALGCIIKGETDHYECVMRSTTDALTQVALNENTPVIQGIIVSPNFQLAWKRRNLGKQYAQTAIEMTKILSCHSREGGNPVIV